MNEATVSNLEAELRDDESGARRVLLLSQLNALRAECQAAKRQLCDRETFRRIDSSNIAVNAAIRIIETLPQRQGGGN